jgi:Pyruvate/2-oxoacid:ferredoxin oxidoreductase delta subunit
MITTEAFPQTLTVVLSAGQSRNPEKRELEDAIAVRAASLQGVKVLRVPHLYDLPNDSQTYQQLRKLSGDLVVLSWLFDRATHWTLDRNGVRGQVGEVLLRDELDDDEVDDDDDSLANDEAEATVATSQPRPDRWIYCIDLKVAEKSDEFMQEISRILDEAQRRTPPPRSELGLAKLAERYSHPTNDTYLGSTATPDADVRPVNTLAESIFGASSLVSIDESPGRRWYPVIDFSRCTNCMECIDFCLFGVYGVDAQETIIVEQADNCRKGCPACSRVCPQNAIMFPQHKTPAIAGAPVDVGGLKIDLSKLFGAPESDEDAATVAARERDEQLLLAGRAAVGASSTTASRSSLAQSPRIKDPDELDQLIDELDSLDL